MRQLAELRRALQFNTELLVLIETLKNIAAQQYHLMEKAKERFDQFMDSFSGFFRVVDLVAVENPLVKVESDVLGLVIVTSDSGFMGGLNQAVVRAAMEAQGEHGDDRTAYVVLGDKGAGLLSSQNKAFKFFPGIAQDTIYERAVDVAKYLVAEVVAKRMGKVVIAYPKPISFSAQTVEAIGILPCGELFDREAKSEVAERVKGRGILAEARKVIVESSYKDMVEYLAGVWTTSKLFEVFEDSKLAEFSARAMHLEGSVQKLEKEKKKVKHECFKAVHEKIDKGMRESFAAKTSKDKRASMQAA